MITQTLKEVGAARARLAQLEAALAAEIRGELARLPGKYGFASTKDFIKAVKAAIGLRSEGTGKGTGRRRRRNRITDEIRSAVLKMARDGKTGTAIAKAVGISLPSIQNIKKAAGLVKVRQK